MANIRERVLGRDNKLYEFGKEPAEAVDESKEALQKAKLDLVKSNNLLAEANKLNRELLDIITKNKINTISNKKVTGSKKK